MKDSDIRRVLRAHLADCHRGEDSLILDELGILQGESRVDLAVINGQLHGYEIKSDRDTLVRLPRQRACYAKCFDTMTLVVGSSHVQKARRMTPRWWGIIEATVVDGTPILTTKREPQANTRVKAEAVIKLVWKAEAVAIAIGSGMPAGTLPRKRSELLELLVRTLSLEEVRRRVRETLKLRGDWRSGPSPFRCDGSSRSSAKSPRSRKGLEWLRGLRFPDRPS